MPEKEQNKLIIWLKVFLVWFDWIFGLGKESLKILMTINLSWNVLVSFINSKKEKKVKSLSRVQLFMTPWTVAYQAPPSMEFSRQEYWSGLPFPSPGDLPNPGIEPRSPAFQADALTFEPPGKPYQ